MNPITTHLTPIKRQWLEKLPEDEPTSLYSYDAAPMIRVAHRLGFVTYDIHGNEVVLERGDGLWYAPQPRLLMYDAQTQEFGGAGAVIAHELGHAMSWETRIDHDAFDAEREERVANAFCMAFLETLGFPIDYTIFAFYDQFFDVCDWDEDDLVWNMAHERLMVANYLIKSGHHAVLKPPMLPSLFDEIMFPNTLIAIDKIVAELGVL